MHTINIKIEQFQEQLSVTRISDFIHKPTDWCIIRLGDGGDTIKNKYTLQCSANTKGITVPPHPFYIDYYFLQHNDTLGPFLLYTTYLA